MRKNVVIPYELYNDLVEYFTLPFPESDTTLYQKIQDGLYKKEESIRRHEMYTCYKSASKSSIRAKARQEYLDSVGMSQSFRWSDPAWSPWHPE